MSSSYALAANDTRFVPLAGLLHGPWPVEAQNPAWLKIDAATQSAGQPHTGSTARNVIEGRASVLIGTKARTGSATRTAGRRRGAVDHRIPPLPRDCP